MLRLCAVLTLCTALSAALGADLSAQAIVARDYGLTPPYRELSVNATNCSALVKTLTCADEGVTFNSAVYLPENSGFNPFIQVGQGSVANGVNTNLDFSVSILFNRQVRSAAFNFLGFNDPLASKVRFDAMLGDELVSSFTSTERLQFNLAPREALSWWGFENSVFDRIVISAPFVIDRENGSTLVYTMALNNLQIQDAVEEPTSVPEPTTLALAMIGVSGLLIAARRRRR